MDIKKLLSPKRLLSPKNTEEIKPGLFVQNRKGKYRVVKPIVWNGEYRLKDQFSWKSIITIVLILFIAWTYFEETEFCRQLQENPCELLPNITSYCFEQSSLGVFGGDENKREDSYPIQNNP